MENDNDEIKVIANQVTQLKNIIVELEIAIDCLIADRQYTPHDLVGFNSQMARKQIFLDLIQAFDFHLIIETGTWTGNTSAFMLQNSGVPVCSVELNERFHAIAKMRLEGIDGIQLEQGESSEFLKKLARGKAAQLNSFFYLDAHWYNDLPLERELDIIAEHWKGFVIMVDDFQVPDDEGYRYDKYPNGQALDYASYAEIFARHQLVPFFPSTSGDEETGAKSGCVILIKEGAAADAMDKVSSLRRYQD